MRKLGKGVTQEPWLVWQEHKKSMIVSLVRSLLQTNMRSDTCTLYLFVSAVFFLAVLQLFWKGNYCSFITLTQYDFYASILTGILIENQKKGGKEGACCFVITNMYSVLGCISLRFHCIICRNCLWTIKVL